MRYITHTTIIIVFVCFVSSVISGSANASTPLRWFGNDARNAAMGNSGLALGNGPGNLLINPALMSFSPPGIWVGFTAAPNLLSIETDEKSSMYDVPDTIYSSPNSAWQSSNGSRLRDRPVPSSMTLYQTESKRSPSTIYQLHFAYVREVIWPDFRVGLGLNLPLPAGLAWDIWYNDEREQHFTNQLHFDRFGEFDTIMTVYPGISYAPLDWFAVGISVRIDLGISMDAGMYLPDEDEFEFGYVSSSGKILPILRPIAGLAFKTPFGLRIGLCYRHESYSRVDANAWLRTWDDEADPGEEADANASNIVQQRHDFVLGYEPLELAGAVGYEYDPIKIEFGVAWERWSRFLDHHNNSRSHPTWDPEDNTSESGWDDDWKDPSFDDIATFRSGLEWNITDFAAARIGMAYYPTPMPEPTGRYNYLDNDLFLYSVGAGFRFPIFGREFTVDIAGQVWHMPTVSITKNMNLTKEQGGIIDEVPDTLTDVYEIPLQGVEGTQTNNPGVPGFEYGGLVFNAMIVVGTGLDWDVK